MLYYIELSTAIMYGHISSFAVILAIRKELAHEVFEGETSLLEYTGFSILRENNVFGA